MRFVCRIDRQPDGSWTVRHDESDLGRVEVSAASREGAVEKMRNELRYRLELCPCSGEIYQQANIEIVEQSGESGPR